MTVIDDQELYGEKVEALTLTAVDGAALSDIEQDATRVEVNDTDPNYMVAYVNGASGHPSAEHAQAQANKKAFTVWVALEVRNTGGRPARNIVADFTVLGADLQTGQPSSGENVLIDKKELSADGLRLRQRIKQVAAGVSEKLVVMGLTPHDPGTGNDVAEASVHYALRRENGGLSEGTFNVRVRIRGTITLTLRQVLGHDDG